jgi:UDP-N-acetylmuramoyl-tripeptide--D-alanyl-D-alanine ligase
VVNGDDPRCLAIAAAARARAVRVGFGAGCDWRIGGARVEFPQGTQVELAGPRGALAIGAPWIGDGMARCLAAAAAFGVESGLDGATVRDGLAGLRPLPERLEAVPLAGGAWLLCDSWKASWETIESAFFELGRLAGWRRIALLGDIDEVYGDRTATYHRYARLAVAAAERIVYVGRNYKVFRAGAKRAGLAPGRLRHCRDVQQAAAELAPEVTAGTVILIKGSHRQKLGRIRHLLQGAPVSCELRVCLRTGLSCDLCPLLTARTSERTTP